MVVVTQIPFFQPDEKAADREIWFELREVAAGRSDGRGLPLVIKDRLCAHLRRDYILFPWCPACLVETTYFLVKDAVFPITGPLPINYFLLFLSNLVQPRLGEFYGLMSLS